MSINGHFFTKNACSMKTYLVESDHEGRLAFLEQVDGLDGLRLEAVHDVDHQDGDITERGTAAT